MRCRTLKLFSLYGTMAPQDTLSAPVFRKPRRISITVPHHAFCVMQERSDLEGRSLSNLAAYLLELSLDQHSRAV